MSIFVLADTHNKFPEKLLILARDADEIWHLGDVCAERILDELRATGPPVTVVRGNCDSNFEWPLVVDLVRGGKFDGARITGVGVTKDAHSRIARENAFESSLGIFGAVRDDNHACVLRISDADAPTVMD
jgi:predicted phosphodiesterase